MNLVVIQVHKTLLVAKLNIQIITTIPEEEEYCSDDIKAPFELFPDFSSRVAQCEDIYTFGITEEAWREEATKLAWSMKDIPNDRLAFNVIKIMICE